MLAENRYGHHEVEYKQAGFVRQICEGREIATKKRNDDLVHSCFNEASYILHTSGPESPAKNTMTVWNQKLSTTGRSTSEILASAEAGETRENKTSEAV